MPSTTMHGTGSKIPADGVEFQLTLKNIPDPMQMVRRGGNGSGYNPTSWQYNGSPPTPRTGRFKLVRVGDCLNLYEVMEKLKRHGKLPEGQWREAFTEVYPLNDGNGPIGFADPKWVGINAVANFPVCDGAGREWRSRFGWAGRGRYRLWRWLVEVE